MYLLVVTTQAIYGRLFFGSRLLHDNVGGPLGRSVSGGCGTAVLAALGAVETAAAAKEDGHLVVEDLLARVGQYGRHAVFDNGGAALVYDLEEAGAGRQAAGGGEGPLADLEVLLAVEEHHGGEVGYNGVVVKGHLGVEGGDDAEGGENLEVLAALKDVLEVGGLGADAEVVEDGITILVLVLGGGTLLLQGFADGGKMLVASGGGGSLSLGLLLFRRNATLARKQEVT